MQSTKYKYKYWEWILVGWPQIWESPYTRVLKFYLQFKLTWKSVWYFNFKNPTVTKWYTLYTTTTFFAPPPTPPKKTIFKGWRNISIAFKSRRITKFFFFEGKFSKVGGYIA